MIKTYVFPHCASFEKDILKIKGISRLYAYPKEPRFDNIAKDEIILLNSGAYAYKYINSEMDIKYMKKLSAYYRKWHTEAEKRGIKLFCIAPDKWLDPVRSMLNIKKWYDNDLFPDITAVLQNTRKNHFDLDLLKYQADYYSNFTDEIFVANNNFTANMAKSVKMERIFKYLKEEKDVEWVHFLGAGWDLKDIKEWLTVNYLDSIDSVAYFTSKNKEDYGGDNPIENIKNICKLVCGGEIIV